MADDLEELVQATLTGAPNAFAELALALWPFAAAAGKRAREAEDEGHELYARLLEKLEAEGRAGLATYPAWRTRHPEKTFADWVRIVLANLARDLQRERSGRARGGEETKPSAKRLLNELGGLAPLDGLGYRPPVTSEQTAREILAFAEAHLPPLQCAALAAWVEGEDFAQVSARTGIPDEASAVRLVRAALATLRRRFAAA